MWENKKLLGFNFYFCINEIIYKEINNGGSSKEK